MDYLRSIKAGFVVWTLAIVGYTTSYFIPVMEDVELQSNIVLMVILVPVVIIGAKYYYKNGNTTNGLKVGIGMFITAGILDAIITVPFLIMPYGGTHYSFFTDPFFWVIAAIYVGTVTIYSKFKSTTNITLETV